MYINRSDFNKKSWILCNFLLYQRDKGGKVIYVRRLRETANLIYDFVLI